MSTTRTKRNTNKNTSTSALLYTTHNFVDRLCARGRSIRIDVRDVLLHWIHSTQTPIVWDQELINTDQILASVPPIEEGVVPLIRLCALLSPLDKLDLQYVNIAVILHSMTPIEIKNFYRYCYLEWMQCNMQNETLESLWTHTPNKFSRLDDSEFAIEWERFLTNVFNYQENHHAPMVLFFLNRLYCYLTPCG